MKRLPNIAEAVIPGTPFGIEILKAVFVLGCVLSLIGSIPGLHFQFVANHDLFSRLLSLGYAVLFGIGSYGIHRRMHLAWKVGWFYLGLFYVLSIHSAMTAPNASKPAQNQLITLAVLVVMFSAVAAYWGNWWRKQKSYFKS